MFQISRIILYILCCAHLLGASKIQPKRTILYILVWVCSNVVTGLCVRKPQKKHKKFRQFKCCWLWFIAGGSTLNVVLLLWCTMFARICICFHEQRKHYTSTRSIIFEIDTQGVRPVRLRFACKLNVVMLAANDRSHVCDAECVCTVHRSSVRTMMRCSARY